MPPSGNEALSSFVVVAIIFVPNIRFEGRFCNNASRHCSRCCIVWIQRASLTHFPAKTPRLLGASWLEYEDRFGGRYRGGLSGLIDEWISVGNGSSFFFSSRSRFDEHSSQNYYARYQRRVHCASLEMLCLFWIKPYLFGYRCIQVVLYYFSYARKVNS